MEWLVKNKRVKHILCFLSEAVSIGVAVLANLSVEYYDSLRPKMQSDP